MYSPFSDSKGRPLTIEKVKFSHLSQLVDCDEGHHVEYKLLLEDGGKAQLAKEITSFANCEGGWLIVGIDDKTKELKNVLTEVLDTRRKELSLVVDALKNNLKDKEESK